MKIDTVCHYCGKQINPFEPQASRGKRPMTSKQIALEMGMDRHEVARRLPEMARKGLIMRQDRDGKELNNEGRIARNR